MRGYGEIKLNKIEKAEFALNESAGLSAWLDFDMFDYDKWEPFTEATAGNTTGLTVKLHQKSGISIRHYTTKVSTEAKTEPDFEQMTLNDATPVIPGTSWAGAFRHRMEEFGIQRGKGSIFGYVEGDGDDEKAVSCIRFGESTIKDAKEKVLSRNAIDRFSGGTKDGALFTERTYYGGTTELKISWRARKGKTMDDKEKEALAAALTDLHFGFMAVGGEASIGRGLFEIEAVNGKDVPKVDSPQAKDAYEIILSAVKEAF
jgi:CRISPR/Cas system CSM-associated protein Csm3 (group 7 of RAMP superfamily)